MDLKEDTVVFRHGDTELEGYVVHDASLAGKLPGIMIIHQWEGPGDFEIMKARMYAEKGYAVLVADMYGKGIRPKGPKEAGAQAGKFRGDRKLMRERAAANLKELNSFDFVDPSRIVVTGYCFGGGCALELARSGADVKGVIVFHGPLDTPNPADAKNIRGKVLVLTGAEDPNIPWTQIEAFKKEMDDSKVDWYMTVYAAAVHAFTIKSAGNDPSKGSAYNEKADIRSWRAAMDFLDNLYK
jgi:dienelactone hydrolase